jgi:isocitrate dehydrogenase kinase/phosphatase
MPPEEPSTHRLAQRAAEATHAAFQAFGHRFAEVTGRAKRRFERRDWRGMMADMAERLELHSLEVDRTIARLRGLLGEGAGREPLWRAAREAYAALVTGRPNRELAETFFNSVSRRMLGTIGKNPETEFDAEQSLIDPRREDPPVYDRHPWEGDTARAVRRILEACAFEAPFEDLRRDARLAAAAIDDYLVRILGSNRIDALETIRPVFFRQKLAYVIGRIRTHVHVLPLVLPLRHTERGIALDAVLMSQDELSIVFSFTRSHFHVLAERPRELIVFLKGIMPLKSVAELYIALGFHKHGKTELYRSLRSHLRGSIDRFEFAKGDPGMVMLVFTLPFYSVVFKVIRDRFAYPKKNTRRDVMERYRLVFRHDRVGRLVEAQEFEHLEFRAEQFQDDLLKELLREAGSTVSLRDGAVVIRHVYVERRVTPLNVYLREATEDEALEAVRDYGDAVKELAAANIFPGDFLLKNFGVTRHGRVVFYDYDELGLTTDCRFRSIPTARSPDDELCEEPWFTVGEHDVFPEEFRRFLGLPEPLRAGFERHHADLFEVGFWRDVQARLRAGEIMDVYPYPRSRRLGG